MADILLYLAVLLAGASLIFLGERKKFFLISLLGILLVTTFSAFRFEVGTDYTAYLNLHTEISSQSITEFNDGRGKDHEVGTYLVSKIASITPYSNVMFFGIFSFLTILFFYLGLRKYKLSQSWLTLAFIFLLVFPDSFNGIRQMLAVSIFFYASNFILTRKFLKFTALVILASLFHKSALFMLPLYLLGKYFGEHRKLNPKGLLLIAGIASGVIIFSQIILDFLIGNFAFFEKYNKYQELGQASSGLLVLAKALLLGFVITVFRHIARRPFVLWFLCLSVIELAILIASLSSVEFGRFSMYFAPFSWVLVAYTYQAFEKKHRLIFASILFIFAVSYFTLLYYVLGASEIFPYTSIWGDLW